MIQDVAQQSQYWNELINSAAHSSGLPASQVAVTMLDEPDNKKLLVNFLSINGVKASTKDATIDLAKKAHDLLTNATAQIININKQAGYTITPQTAYGKLLDQFSRQTANNYTKNANQAEDGKPARYSVMGFDFGDAIAVVSGAVTGVFGTPAAGVAVFSGVEGIKNSSQGGSAAPVDPQAFKNAMAGMYATYIDYVISHGGSIPPAGSTAITAGLTSTMASLGYYFDAANRKWIKSGTATYANPLDAIRATTGGNPAAAPGATNVTLIRTNGQQTGNVAAPVAVNSNLLSLDGVNLGGKQVKWTSLGFGAVGILLLIALFSGGKKK